MNKLSHYVLLACMLVSFNLHGSQPVGAANGPGLPAGVEDLGQGRYRVGPILVNQAQRYFEVRGRVLRREPPLEYLAVAPGGMKGYESLLELESGGTHFNLACILIGLKPPTAVDGDWFGKRVQREGFAQLSLSWLDQNDNVVRRPASQLLSEQGRAELPEDWTYVGSTFSQDGRYRAETYGTLIGFAHDLNSVLEHRTGLGIGRYGSVGANMSIAPVEGTAVTLGVQYIPGNRAAP